MTFASSSTLSSARGEVSYVLPSHAEAVDWRRRAYKFRKLIMRDGERKYGALMLRLPAQGKPGDCTITFDQRVITGQLLDTDGFPVDMFDLMPPSEEVIE